MDASSVTVLAIDLGSSNGRAMLARFDGERISLEEVARFANGPVELTTGLHWDVEGLFGEVEMAIARAVREKDGAQAAVGVDTWGVDYGLLDGDGELLGPPFAYRDGRTEGMVERVHGLIGPEELYRRTGSQTVAINTLYQLMSERGGPRWERAERMLLIPDLVAHRLTGDISTERTIASTTQLYDPVSGGWADDVIGAVGLPRSWFPEIVEPGTIRGGLRRKVAERVGASSDLPVVTVASHDTASAFAATPTAATSFVISVGTWSLAGVERGEALITEAGRAANLTNEVGMSGTIRLLKNAGGMWILQQCRAAWGGDRDWGTLQEHAAHAPSLRALIDPDDLRLVPPGDMPGRIRAMAVEGGYAAPEDEGTVVRVVLESLALRYRELVEEMEHVTGRALPAIHVVSGGARNRLLCQLTADATGRKVLAGPAEATALGNAGVQLMALGHIGDLGELREVVGRSVEVEWFEPAGERGAWDEMYGRFRGRERSS